MNKSGGSPASLPEALDDLPSVPLRLTSHLRVAQNAVLSLYSEIWTLLVVFVTMPIVIHALGADAFGLFSLAWVVLGYMAILDFGVSRAATKFISEHLSRGELAPVERIARASVAANLVLGVIGGGIVLALAGWLANRVFHVPVELQTEARTIFRALAMSIPILLVQAVLRAILCSYQRFGWISIFNALATTLQWTSACALAWLGFHVGMIVVVSVVFPHCSPQDMPPSCFQLTPSSSGCVFLTFRNFSGCSVLAVGSPSRS